MKSTWWKQ